MQFFAFPAEFVNVSRLDTAALADQT
jgi:hypothetical protein